MVVNCLDRSAFLKLLPSVGVAGFYVALGLCWMLNVLASQSKCRSRGKGGRAIAPAFTFNTALSTPRRGDPLSNVFRTRALNQNTVKSKDFYLPLDRYFLK
jgi:hypothetical protein